MAVLALPMLLAVSMLAPAQSPEFIEAQIEKWKQEVVEDPQDYKTISAIGSAYGKLRRYDEAVAYFKRSIAIRPT